MGRALFAGADLPVWFGLLKFTNFEASGIAPLVMNSPLIMWLQASLGVSSSAVAIGCIEVVAGILLALRPLLPRIAAVGAGMAAITFLITTSFLLTTPGVIQPGESPPFALSPMPGQFLLKDVVLLFVSLWILGACLDEARARR